MRSPNQAAGCLKSTGCRLSAILRPFKSTAAGSGLTLPRVLPQSGRASPQRLPLVLRWNWPARFPRVSSGANRVNITNNSNSTGLLVSGTHQRLGNIDGSGTTQVNAGSDLTANHIIQSALVIGGTSGMHGLVTIDASDASGNPLGQSSGFVVASSLTPSGPFEAGETSSASFGSGDGTDLEALLAGNPAVGDNLAPVPEPSTFLLALVAVLGVVSTQFARHHLRSQSV